MPKTHLSRTFSYALRGAIIFALVILSFLPAPLLHQLGLESGYGVGDASASDDTMPNTAPVADNDSYSTNEDTALNVAAPGVLDGDTDADNDILTAVLDSDTENGALTLNDDGSFNYTPNANYCGPDSFAYHANDGLDDSNVATASIDVVCVNDAPSVTADQATVTVDEGQTAENSGAVSDVEGEGLTLKASVGSIANNGDGTWSWSFVTSDGPAESQTVTVFAYDASGDSGQTTFALTVNNVAPEMLAITGPTAPVGIDDLLIDFSGVYTDPEGANDLLHTCTVDYGDGAGAQPGTVSGDTCSGSHSYDEAGVYAVTMTVTDEDGASGSSEYQYVVVYDPDGGFVTGGGWIDSPPGAYTRDPSLTGRATFGFVSKYKKGASRPGGNTEFQFRAADLNFHSGNYDWLVISNHKAMYKGTGTINGNGDYGFMLAAIDAELANDADIDLFRIKIWDKDSDDAVVYDNQVACPDTGDDADPCTEIGGGSIVIHKGKGNN